MSISLHLGDCLEVMRTMEPDSVDSIVCDPPYMLNFMGKAFDRAKDNPAASVEVWAAALRVAKPGAMLLAFGGDRTHHRMMTAIEDAGWEIRTCLYWVFASGFPKSHSISKAIDKRGGQAVGWFGPWFRSWRRERGISSNQVAQLFPSKTGGETGCVRNWELGLNLPTPEQFNLICQTYGLPFASLEEAEREVVGQQKQGRLAVAPGQGKDRSAVTLDITAPATDAARQWDGWGTALKPAAEIIVMARKPIEGTVAENTLKWGVGGINIDACRIEGVKRSPEFRSTLGETPRNGTWDDGNCGLSSRMNGDVTQGRWPSNLLLDEGAAAALDQQSGERKSHDGGKPLHSGDFGKNGVYGKAKGVTTQSYGDAGGASRFFWVAKASKRDRGEGNNHPCVKPETLCRYLVRLVTPPAGTVLDPFMGSGSTGKAAKLEGFNFVGIEKEADYLEISRRRIEAVQPETQAQMQPHLLEVA